MVLSIIKELKPDYIVAAFDMAEPTFRDELYKEYKGKRQKIEDELKEVRARIKDLQRILSSDKEILKVVKNELLDMKKRYADERRTKVIAHEIGGFSDRLILAEKQR